MRRLMVSYLLTIMIIILVLIVHGVDQPWRGIIDAGVVIGLAWGLLSMLYFIVLAFVANNFACSPEVPGTDKGLEIPAETTNT